MYHNQIRHNSQPQVKILEKLICNPLHKSWADRIRVGPSGPTLLFCFGVEGDLHGHGLSCRFLFGRHGCRSCCVDVGACFQDRSFQIRFSRVMDRLVSPVGHFQRLLESDPPVEEQLSFVFMGWVPFFITTKLPFGIDFSSSADIRGRSIICRDW